MGICLDTAASPVVGPVYQPHLKGYSTTRLTTHLPYRGIKRPPASVYMPPGVLVYVIGGPGTGKVTLSEAVTQRSNGKLAHISMTKVLKDYAKHFDLESGSMVPSSSAVEILTARLKASPVRRGFVISGFPRNIEDAVDCTKKTGVLTPEAGEQELNEFLTNVTPLADVMHNYQVLHKVAACRRRLELYRTVTLPAAKALDDAHRLLVPQDVPFIIQRAEVGLTCSVSDRR
ncbi:Adenylate kinase 1 [Amphibalanus amphitrite]|uniref:Adenylate kinase 1 n=1 Tax=Amphibalanus amphitrite TaxID=1232801 RepID=A0A6A4WGV4_AMPAM|nr:Adenylate kinase 1 [Amphibalanus amphitrite]